MSTYNSLIENIREQLVNILKIFKPNKVNLIIASSVLLISIILLGGFPLDVIHEVEGFCPSFPSDGSPVDCVDSNIELDKIGLILNIATIYAASSLFTELVRRRSQWL